MNYLAYNKASFPLTENALNYNIMLQLDDDTLANLCETSLEVQAICNDDNFWRSKLELIIGRRITVPSLPGYEWRTLYDRGIKYVKEPNQWIYVLVISRKYKLRQQVYNDSLLVYNALLDELSAELQITRSKLLSTDLSKIIPKYTYDIQLVKLGDTGESDTEFYSIFQINNRADNNMIIDETITYYPRLTVEDVIMEYGNVFMLITDARLAYIQDIFSSYITLYPVNGNRNATFRKTRIGFIERWTLPIPLLITNDVPSVPMLQNLPNFVLIVLDPSNFIPPNLDARLTRQGRYLREDIAQLLVNSQILPLSQLINYL